MFFLFKSLPLSEDSPLDVHKKDALTGSLLNAADAILAPQTHFGSVFLEVKKLFGVEGSTSLPVKTRKEGEAL